MTDRVTAMVLTGRTLTFAVSSSALLLMLSTTACAASGPALKLFLPVGCGAAEKTVASLAAQGKYEDALRKIDIKSADQATRGRNLILRAQIEEAQDKTELAEKDIEAAWRTGKLDEFTEYWAVERLRHFSNSSVCREMCNKLVKSKEPLVAGHSYFVRARINSNDGHTADAVKDYEASMKLNPRETDAYVECGNLCQSCGKYQQAVEIISRGLTVLDEKTRSGRRLTISALRARARAYTKLKRFKEALADYNCAIKLGPLVRELFQERAEVRRALGDQAGADADLAHLRSIDDAY